MTVKFEHIKSASDLVTPYANTRASFLQMALEKNIRATPFVAQARDLKEKLQSVPSADALLAAKGISGALLAAAGISAKASGHIDDHGKQQAIENLIENFLKPQGDSFREELIYRFLLTNGDSLGGSMRNIVGALAQRKLAQAIMARLENANSGYKIELNGKIVQYNKVSQSDKSNAEKIKSISWNVDNLPRTLSFNITVPLVKKNVDMCLLGVNIADVKNNTANAKSYICLGELKGGADPAGADEHWKTANSALQRIDIAFKNSDHTVKSCFIGAAIADAMAREIWDLLIAGKLTFAANLTVDAHVFAFCDWLVSI